MIERRMKQSDQERLDYNVAADVFARRFPRFLLRSSSKKQREWRNFIVSMIVEGIKVGRI
jgi:hypothetical protein